MEDVFTNLIALFFTLLILGSPIWLVLYFGYRNKKRSKVAYGIDVLDLGKAVFVIGEEATECESFALNSTLGGFVVMTAEGSVLFKFDNFTHIYTRLNLNNPVVYMITKDNKHAAVYFTDNVQSIRALKANLVTTLAFGEAVSGAILANMPGALGAKYGQILKDRVSLTENWLKYHKVSAYTARFDRGTRMAMIFILPVLVLMVALSASFIKDAL